MKPLPLAALRGLAVGAFMALVVVVPSTQNAQAISPVSWLNNSLFAPVPGLGNLNDGLYLDLTKGTLVPERGPTFSNARAQVSSTVDNEGLVRSILSSEARFWKLRRVYNQNSGNTDTARLGVWEDTAAAINGGTASKTITVSITAWTDSGTARFRLKLTHGAVVDDFSPDITATTTKQRFSFTRTNSSAAGNGNMVTGIAAALVTDGSANVRSEKIQTEDVTSQSITAPSEYVSKGVLSSPWHGAGVDGVKYFNTANGNVVRENLVLRSEEFDNASWTKTRSSVTANTIASPDGPITADKLVEDATAANTHFQVQTVAVSAGPLTFSVYAKAAERGRFTIREQSDSGNGSTFDLSTGTVVANQAGGVGTITALANGWYRCSMTGTETAGSRQYALNINTASGSGNEAYNGDGSSGLYFWGAQLNKGNNPATYVATTTAAVNTNIVDEGSGSPLTVTGSGIWPNGAHTNIALQSEDLGTAPWAVIGTPTRVAANVRLGDLVLDLIGDDDGLGVEGYSQAITFTGDGVKTVSLHMKAGTSIESVVRLRDSTPVAADRLLAGIAWSGGVPTTTMTTGTLESTETLANGVYRFNFTTTAVTAANANALEVYPASSTSLLGTRTGTVNVGGVMVQNATTNGRYVKTTTASVAVPADVITASGATVINQTEGTLWAEFIVSPTAQQSVPFEINDGSSNELVLLQDTGPAVRILVHDGGVAQASVTAGTLTTDEVAKVAGRYRLNDVNAAEGGAAGTADTTATMPAPTMLRIGSVFSGNAEPNTPVKRIAYSRTGASDANLAVATTP